MTSPFDSNDGKEAKSKLKTDELVSAISKGTVTEEILQRCAQDGSLDLPDKDGQTPLMLACLAGLEDVVKFLLANGANPNSKTTKEENTPMHYACMVADTTKDESLSGKDYKPSKFVSTKVSIVKLLLSYEALVVQNNLNGWSSPCVAALYMLKDAVDFFLLMDDEIMPPVEKIKVAEILGVSQATQNCDEFGQNDAIHSFCRAITLQQDARVLKGPCEYSELGAGFSKINLKEFHTLDEIKSNELSDMYFDDDPQLEEKERVLKAHAILVAERLFTSSLKQKYFLPSLLDFLTSLSMDYPSRDFGEDGGFHIYSYILSIERQEELPLGTVAVYVTKLFERGYWVLRDCALGLLDAYGSVLNSVHTECLLKCNSLMDSFGHILYHDADSGPSFDHLKIILRRVEELLKIIQGRICRERPYDYPRMPSVSLKIMSLLTEYSFADSGKRSLKRIAFVLLRVLLLDNASYQDVSSGNTLLHNVALCANSPIFWDIQILARCARAFRSQFCPIEAVNYKQETARHILFHGPHQTREGMWSDFPGEHMHHIRNVNALQEHLSPPITVLRLEEAAARVVVRYRINYQTLPPRIRRLVKIVEDDAVVSVLEDLESLEPDCEDSDYHELSD